jgi:hypothetical protein
MRKVLVGAAVLFGLGYAIDWCLNRSSSLNRRINYLWYGDDHE